MDDSRASRLADVLSGESSFRIRQAEEALYGGHFRSWTETASLPKVLRERLEAEIPWLSVSKVAIFPSKRSDAWKALLRTSDGNGVESVLMRNSRNHFTVCVSTQIGCAMNCAFCATGKIGLIRNLSQDEIVDQVRFFRGYVADSKLSGEITNIVLMGMGEPLANYEEVREALRTFTGPMGIGTTRITVSTVGLLPGLDRLVKDPDWPPVRIAVSLHAANENTRKNMMPTTSTGFLDRLVAWSHDYAEAFPEKRRHLTFEYLLLAGINDSEEDARKLIALSRRVGKVRINLIPYNSTDSIHSGSDANTVMRFKRWIESNGITVTIRKSQGGDIAAACGQLAGKTVSGERITNSG
ncbi:MAG: 23S rRNA (adenine(2503)-C(2))-methyltransferase RlmN [Candidatus Moranbacteria bacterium]|nr:23S rRNA (adenine(2503)-C(2))-methyltransferase RlmN [Candidatus Moranbacteria bacterium]